MCYIDIDERDFDLSISIVLYTIYSIYYNILHTTFTATHMLRFYL